MKNLKIFENFIGKATRTIVILFIKTQLTPSCFMDQYDPKIKFIYFIFQKDGKEKYKKLLKKLTL